MFLNPTPIRLLLSPQLADLAACQDPRQNGFLTICVRSASALPSSQEDDRQGWAASGLSWAASLPEVDISTSSLITVGKCGTLVKPKVVRTLRNSHISSGHTVACCHAYSYNYSYSRRQLNAAQPRSAAVTVSQSRWCAGMAFQDLEARRLSRYGPCRDLAQATELREETLLAIDAWYRSHRQKYGNPTDHQCMTKGRKQWMAYCEQLCQERPEFRCTDGISTSYSFISPETNSARAEKRELFWDWLARSVKDDTNRVLNESPVKQLKGGSHQVVPHLPAEDVLGPF